MNSQDDSTRSAPGASESKKQSPGAAPPPEPLYLYKDSGIQERHGAIPAWLLAVTAALILWGVYYLVAFWSPPH